jgi:hypothetical protein
MSEFTSIPLKLMTKYNKFIQDKHLDFFEVLITFQTHDAQSSSINFVKQ